MKNPLAFPRPHSWDESPISGTHEGDRPEPHGAQDGMTLRDYFAAKALQGLLANPNLMRPILGELPGWVETSAYRWADTMLKVREDL